MAVGKGNPPGVGINDPHLKRLLDNISERIDVLSANRGDPLDRALTPRDLIDMGLARRLGRAAQRLVSGGNLVSTVGPGSSLIPPAPTGFAVTGGLAHIFLEWDNARQAYGNHGYSAIFRNTEDNLANAIEVAQTTGSFNYADLDVHYGTDYYYWIRFVSTANVMGPPNSPNGTLGKLAQDPTELLERLSGEIAATHLANDLRTRINLIDNPATGLIDRAQSEAARLTQEINARAAAVSLLVTQLENEVSARVAALAGVDARLDPAELQLIDQEERIIALEVSTGDGGAVASAIETLDTRVGTIDNALVAQATKNAQLDAAIAGKASASAFDGLQTTVTNLGNTVSSESTRLTNLSNTVNDSGSGLAATASAVNTLTTRVNNAETNINSASDSITSLTNRANDSVTGFSALGTAVTNLNSSVSIADGKATTAGSDITAINQRLDNATTGLGAINSQLSSIGGRVSSAEGSIEAQGFAIDSLNQAVNDPATGIEATNNAISALTTDINAVDGRVDVEAGKIVTINQRLDNSTTGLNALNTAKDGILSQINDSSTGLSAHNSKILALETAVNNPTTGLSAIATATDAITTQVNNSTTGLTALGTQVTSIKSRIDSIGGSASSIESIATTVNHSTSGVVATASKVAALESRLEDLGASSESIESIANTVTHSENGVLANSVKYDAIKSRIDNIGGGATSIESLTTAVNHSITGLSATATKTSQLEARLNNVGGITMEQKFTSQADSITGLYGQYTLKIDVNGRVSGFGLASTNTASTFIINADRFAIGKPGTVVGDIYPFIVDTATGSVVMEGAFIKNATINDAQVGNINVTKITGITASFIIGKFTEAWIDAAYIVDAAITSAKIQDASITTAKIASVIQSSNYNPGIAGWQIQKSGAAEFNGIVISRPNVVADDVYTPAAGWHFVYAYVGGTSATPAEWLQSVKSKYLTNVNAGETHSAVTEYEVADLNNFYREFLIDTGWDHAQDISDIASAAFSARANVATTTIEYNAPTLGSGVNTFYLSTSCTVEFRTLYSMGGSGVPGVGSSTRRVFIRVRVNIHNIHPQIYNIRVGSIAWALHRLT